MRICFTLLLCALMAHTVHAQKTYVPNENSVVGYEPSEVVDADYGITLYARMNVRLNGDSVRKCSLGVCNAYVHDFYKSGKLMHRGYYQQGKLVNYKNYYEDGTIEREYRHIDDYKSGLKTYYPSGNIRSHVKYKYADPLKWTDYYENGNIEYYEEYDSKQEFFTKRNSYYENGNPKALLVLESKKKHLYTETVYFEGGAVQETGSVEFHAEILDYIRTGMWQVYDESGKLIKEQDYVYGKVNETFER